MKLALTIWGNRISPVFDSARKLLIVEVKNTKVVKRQYESINFETASGLTQILSDLKINVLICGAISREFSNVIETSAIKLIPFITGNVDAVLESYIKNNRVIAEFFMPGCRNTGIDVEEIDMLKAEVELLNKRIAELEDTL